jgi:thiol:disulfide interchange protein DsbC
MNTSIALRTGLAALTLALPLLATAQEAAIRKNLAARLPALPSIDEVRKTPMNGLYEVRVGTEVFYTDAEGDFLLQGQLLDTRSRKNLTEERINKLTAINFGDVPLKNGITIVRGNGKRRLVLFEDPNCGYCKRLEAEFQQMKDVTVYTFMIPILGGDGKTKIDSIWCSKDRTSAWRDWMLSKVQPTFGLCAGSPSERNLALAQRLNITGTPAVFFEDGTRSPGFEPAASIEQRLRRAEARTGG